MGEMGDVKVAVGISGGILARYAVFYDSLMHVERPPGTIDIQARGACISENRNGIAERALAMGCSHVWYVDDDQVFAPDTLMRLLAHDKDVVSGLYLQRGKPFHPQVYDVEDERGFCKPRLLQDFDHGLVKAVATGAGCLLVKTDVFRKLEKPWWRLGQIIPDGWCDDMNWCHRVRAAGFDVWADLDVLVGHEMSMTVWPMRLEDGSWKTALVAGSVEPLVVFPAARRPSRLVTA